MKQTLTTFAIVVLTLFPSLYAIDYFLFSDKNKKNDMKTNPKKPNKFIGTKELSATSMTGNTAIGYKALSGNQNTAVGYRNTAEVVHSGSNTVTFSSFDLMDSLEKEAYLKRIDSSRKAYEIEKATFKYKAKEFYREYELEILHLLQAFITIGIVLMWVFIASKFLKD
jgi:hypothetical protein